MSKRHYLGSWTSRKIIRIELTNNEFLLVIGSHNQVKKTIYLLLLCTSGGFVICFIYSWSPGQHQYYNYNENHFFLLRF